MSLTPSPATMEKTNEEIIAEYELDCSTKRNKQEFLFAKKLPINDEVADFLSVERGTMMTIIELKQKTKEIIEKIESENFISEFNKPNIIISDEFADFSI